MANFSGKTQSGTVAASFALAARRHSDRPFLFVTSHTARAYGLAPGPITYGTALSRVTELRAAYALAGYGPGNRVGLMLENRPGFFMHWLALNGLGVSVVPLSADLRPAELAYLIGHSEITLAVAAESHLHRLAGAGVPVVAEADPPGEATPIARAAEPGPRTECALLYTSGTTGRPKGCVLSNDYYLHAGLWYSRIGGLCALREGDRLITPLPLTHINAMTYSSMAMIGAGGCIVQLDRFHPATWWDSVRESEATIAHYLGVMPSMLLNAPPDRRDRVHRLRFGFGAGVDRVHHAAFEQRFGFPLLEAWAMTETGAGAVVIANREPRHVGTNCFGKPRPEVEVHIAAEDGELLVRTAGEDPRAGFFTEYLKDAAATEAAWQGGWFHTGDIVRADADGCLYFVDRKKNIIRRSGENIAAAEVETVLRRHPLVAEVAVAATPDPVREEEVLACIVPRERIDDPPARAAELVHMALRELSYFKVPGWIAFVDALPITASQKVARGELKALAERLVADGSCVDLRALKRRDRCPQVTLEEE